MDDRGLVTALLAGTPDGLAGVYDAYAERLFAYAVTLLHDRDAAADVVHDTLLVARERIGALRDPTRLRPWLYAIARNESLRLLRARRRGADLAEAGQVIDESVDVDAQLRAAELRELVWAAAAALNPGEREVLELTVRHELDGADLAAALGVSPNAASALASRARSSLGKALSALVVARTGRADCAELAALLDGWDGRLTPLLRKRLVRHVERCRICAERRSQRVSPAALLAGVPFALLLPSLRERVLADGANLGLVAHSTELARRAGPWRADGFPRPLRVPAQVRTRRNASIWGAVAAGVALLVVLVLTLPGAEPATVAGAGAAPATSAGPGLPAGPEPAGPAPGAGEPTQGSPGPGSTPPAGASGTEAAGAGTDGPGTGAGGGTGAGNGGSGTGPGGDPGSGGPGGGDPGDPPAGSPPPTTRPEVSDPPSPPPTTAPPTIRIFHTNLSEPKCGRLWDAVLSAEVVGAEARSVTARLVSDAGALQPVPLGHVEGRLWTAQLALPVRVPFSWDVEVTTVDGTVVRSAPADLGYPCDVPDTPG